MAVALREGSPEEALIVLEHLLSIEDPFSEEFNHVELGGWPSIHIYLPHPEVNSSMTPPFMEAFLELQKQIYQLAAQAETGSPDSGQLSDTVKQRFQISVVVTGGSSDYVANLTKPVQELLKTMVGKMTGKQAAVVIVCVATLLAGGWSFTAWLEHVPIICTHSPHDGSSWRSGGRSAVERMNRWRGRGEE